MKLLKLFFLFVLLAPLARADSLVDTFTFNDVYHFPNFTVPSTYGPDVKFFADGANWEFNFTDGEAFYEVRYSNLFVSKNGVGIIDFLLPFFCTADPMFANSGCVAVGPPDPLSPLNCCGTVTKTPWGGSVMGWVPGDYGAFTITESVLVTTPEPNTGLLLGVGCVGGLLALLWSRKNMRASLPSHNH